MLYIEFKTIRTYSKSIQAKSLYKVSTLITYILSMLSFITFLSITLYSLYKIETIYNKENTK